ncbi:MAG: Asp-tRNA(Asn)/Glu-tRNA(Gln) amidotransferase GatCAB subunit C [Deltaproteobacteria bacterium]|nr:MAG: Asp-tRNA(Asn)/Glu-tRNA(Gln) amidotransferase GatCAB subunit C [Deltaproteobacteria bacterium]
MEISLAETRHVAALAALALSDEEVEQLAGELSAILTYIDKLSELDTDLVDPTSHAVEMKTLWREDEVTNGESVEDALANAPRREDGFFVVPSIIE